MKGLTKKILTTLLLLLMIGLVSCNNSGDGFAGAEADAVDTMDLVSPIIIASHSPADNPVIMTDSSEITFALSLSSGSYQANYNFILDGISMQTGSSPFYTLSGSVLTTGNHELKVIVSNPISKDFYLFNIRKNASPTIDSFTPTDVNQTVTCGQGSITLSATASDPEGDNITFQWLLNGIAGSPAFSTTNSANASSTDFAPDCSITGLVTVTLNASDGYDSSSTSWSVLVVNPNIASIDTYTPSANPVVILSTQDKTFSVGASGTAPITYKWYLDSVELPGETTATVTLTSASLSTGTHSLKVMIEDGGGTTDEHTFDIVKNAPPVLSNANSNFTQLKLNYKTTKSLSIQATDANNDPLTYTWTIDGAINPQLTSTVATDGLSSNALISPIESMLGKHTVQVTVSDGYETSSHSWEVVINRFSDTCNNLSAGQVCVLVGPRGLGSDTQEHMRGRAEYITEDLDNLGNFFLSDRYHHVIWYINNSSSDITIFGINIPANDRRIVVGNGSPGISSDGYKNIKFMLWSPKGMAYDTTTHSLFIADYSNKRVVQILADGTGRRVAGQANRSTTNNAAHNDPGVIATEHMLNDPIDVAIDISNRILYVASYSGDNIKKFDISDSDYTNWTGEILVGRTDSNGVVIYNTNYDNYLYGPGTDTASTDAPTALKLSADNKVLYYVEYGADVKVINMSGTTLSFFNGDITVDSGYQQKLFGIAGSPSATDYAYDAVILRIPYGLEILESGGLKGFFISNYDRDTVIFVNNTTSDISLGGVTVGALRAARVFGRYDGNGYNGLSYSGFETKLYTTIGIYLDSNNILQVASRDSGKTMGLDISVADGAVSMLADMELHYDYINSIEPNLLRTNQIQNLKYDPLHHEMYFVDYSNGRIKKFNTIDGSTEEVLGRGRNNNYNEQELPQDAYVYDIADMDFANGQLLYVDKLSARYTTENSHCLVRAYNTTDNALSFWGTSVDPGRIATIAGNYALGCSNNEWDSAYEGAHITDVRMQYPDGLLVHNGEMFISQMYGDCILKVALDGTTSVYLGTCESPSGYSDTISGPIATTTHIQQPGELYLDPRYTTDGNFFFVNRSIISYSKLIYVNRSSQDIVIKGVIAPAGEITEILSIPNGYGYGIAAFDRWICYTSGGGDYRLGTHQVTCFDRDNVYADKVFGSGIGGMISLDLEGIDAAYTKFWNPYDIEFDDEGNLYITERLGNSIRMVKRWW